MAALSAIAARYGVPNTGSMPEPMVAAVYSSVTVCSNRHCDPIISMERFLLDESSCASSVQESNKFGK